MSKIFVSQAANKREIKLSNHVTPWLSFRESHQQKAFESFKTSQSSLNVFIGLNVVLSVYSLFSGWASYLYFPSHFSLAIFILSIFTPALVGMCIITMQLYQRNSSNNSPKIEQLASIVRNLQSLWLFGTSVVFSLNIVLIGKNGFCPPGVDDFEKVQACNIGSEGQMPEDMMMISVIMPGLLAMMVKGAKWEYVVVTFLSNIFAVLFTMFCFDLTSSLPSFLIFIPIAMIVMYENQRQSISLFLLTQNQKNLLEENERLAAETHANELRHMIGNVAHDLKTPLSAFVNGVDMVLGIIAEIELFHQTVADKLPLQANRAVATMKEAVVNMKNTNEFMIMTINRCIDYTKASQGLKLVPRLETIRFLEAINLPLNCMKGLQDNRVVIKLLPVSNNIASHIITDKQWLQENILCLLSNAVKYSAGGEVNVSAVLHTDGFNSTTRNCENKSESASQRRPDPTKNTFIRIEVEDTGIGIAEEMRMGLFCQFKQAQRLAGGTGLGLYSLAKRIETLGGTYGVNSRKDGAQGSLFWFTIPYRPDEQLLSVSNSISVKQKQVASPSLLTETADPSLADSPCHLHHVKSLRSENVDAVDSFRKGLNILVVDDSVSILKMSSMMLRRQGHTVTTADNGAVALRILTEQMMLNNSNSIGNSSSNSAVLFDVVLMDLQMPIMDGLEATSRLRKFEKSFNKQEDSAICTEVMNTVRNNKYGDASQQIARHQLILGVSANSDNETMEAAITAGIDAFIPKPFNIQSFNDVYSKLLAKQNKV